MTETAGLTVMIDGDISGLTEAVNKAQQKIDALSSYTSIGYGGGNFTVAQRHYNAWEKSGIRDIEEKLKWWQNAMDIFSYDSDAVWEARKNIYQISREGADKINDDFRTFAKDNEYFGSFVPDSDEVSNAFHKIENINRQFAENGIITWSEYEKNISEIGNELYDKRAENSEKWLKHEERYNDLSFEEYTDGLKRIEEYTDKYYRDGLINYEKYAQEKAYISNKIAQKNAEEFSSWKNDASVWENDRNLFGDWENKGDSTLEFYNRINSKIEEFYRSGKISWNTMNDEMQESQRNLFKIKSTGDEVFKAWEESAQNWKLLRDTYDDWEVYSDSAVNYYKRCIERISQMYNEGHITWKKYTDDTMKYELELSKAASSSFEAVLSEMDTYINSLKKEYSKEESDLKRNWEDIDRTADLAEISDKLKIYKNSVTERGRDKYKSLMDEYTKLTREDELYRLQEDNNAVIEKLESKYSRAESNKKKILDEIKYFGADLSKISTGIGVDFSIFGSKTEALIRQLICEVQSAAIRIGGAASYTDNRNISIATGVDANKVWGIINGTTVSGLGTVMYGGKRYTGG